MTIAIVSSMILARLLTPSEVGVFSVTMVVIGLLSTLRDLGAGQYLVQEKELTTERIRAVWTVQLALGMLVALAVLGASHPMAAFYGDMRMRDIMLVLAVNYLINPLGSVTYASLMREMRYDAIALIRFTSTATGAAVSVVLALRGHGPISLAWGSLASTVANGAMSLRFRPSGYPWMPGTSEVKRVLSFGSKITATSIMSTFSKGAPEFCIGKIQNLAAAGFYSRSNGLVAMFHRLVSDAVQSVAFSMFSKEARQNGGFATSFLRATSYITALGWSFSLLVICLAHPLIRALYGSQWDESVDLTRLLAFAMVFGVPISLWYSALLSAGAVSGILAVSTTNTLVTIAFAATGAIWGLLPLGAAMVFAAAINSLIWIYMLKTEIGFTLAQLQQTFKGSALTALVSAIGPAGVCVAYGPRPEQIVLPLLFGITGSIVGFLLAVHYFNHPLKDELIRIAAKLRA